MIKDFYRTKGRRGILKCLLCPCNQCKEIPSQAFKKLSLVISIDFLQFTWLREKRDNIEGGFFVELVMNLHNRTFYLHSFINGFEQ